MYKKYIKFMNYSVLVFLFSSNIYNMELESDKVVKYIIKNETPYDILISESSQYGPIDKKRLEKDQNLEIKYIAPGEYYRGIENLRHKFEVQYASTRPGELKPSATTNKITLDLENFQLEARKQEADMVIIPIKAYAPTGKVLMWGSYRLDYVTPIYKKHKDEIEKEYEESGRGDQHQPQLDLLSSDSSDIEESEDDQEGNSELSVPFKCTIKNETGNNILIYKSYKGSKSKPISLANGDVYTFEYKSNEEITIAYKSGLISEHEKIDMNLVEYKSFVAYMAGENHNMVITVKPFSLSPENYSKGIIGQFKVMFDINYAD